MINEDVSVLTSGARSIGEVVGYKYAAIEKRHKSASSSIRYGCFKIEILLNRM